MKIEINLTNKWLYTIIAFLLLIILGFGAYAYVNDPPNPGHGADTIWIEVNGQEMTLQDAIDQDVFQGNFQLPVGHEFGGMYSLGIGGVCQHPNHLTGDCSCPAGFTVQSSTGVSNWDWPGYYCYK